MLTGDTRARRQGLMERSVSMPVGVVVERRELVNRWQRFAWKSVAVIPGAPPVDGWRELLRGERLVRWHAATLPLELHRKETEAYCENLSGKWPAVFVVLRRQTGGERDFAPLLVTASPVEAEHYMDFGDELVDPVPMPEVLLAWVQAFVQRHHVEQPFYKRQRKRHDAGETGGPTRPGGRRADG